jgi:hypothetical protein
MQAHRIRPPSAQHYKADEDAGTEYQAKNFEPQESIRSIVEPEALGLDLPFDRGRECLIAGSLRQPECQPIVKPSRVERVRQCRMQLNGPPTV